MFDYHTTDAGCSDAGLNGLSVKAVCIPELSLYWLLQENGNSPVGDVFSSAEELEIFAAANNFDYNGHIDEIKPSSAGQTRLLWF